MYFTCERERIPWSDSLTNTEDVKAESMVDRLVDQLVRHAVKPHMASQRDRTSTLTLKHKQKKKSALKMKDMATSYNVRH